MLKKMQAKKPIYIIEHLEPELFEWCLIEYEHISETVGKDNLWFTNVKNEKDRGTLKQIGKVFSESVGQMKLEGACILDPEAEETLEPGEGNSYYIFGGILGDFPPRKRTKKELTPFIPDAEARNIGKEQMSTYNAVFTVKQIAENKKGLG